MIPSVQLTVDIRPPGQIIEARAADTAQLMALLVDEQVGLLTSLFGEAFAAQVVEGVTPLAPDDGLQAWIDWTRYRILQLLRVTDQARKRLAAPPQQ